MPSRFWASHPTRGQGKDDAGCSADQLLSGPVDQCEGGEAEVAETTYGGHRLIVRRTRLVGPQATLWPDWRHHAFVTDREGSAVDLDADRRRHTVCELAIRDLKEGAGMVPCPSGRFFANAAWLVIAALAHNLVRWVTSIGLGIEAVLDEGLSLRRCSTWIGMLSWERKVASWVAASR
jgi:hypothetical protein